MLLLVLFLMRHADGLQGALPIIALYALPGYRLMPALQMTYDKATKLRFSGPALDRLHQDLKGGGVSPATDSEPDRALVPRHVISLNDVTYTYPNAKRPAVEDLSLEILAQTTVGLVGATGSGKTTTVDIILGLLEAQSGTLRVDGVEVTQANRRSWQGALGYVPQHIFLADETTAANIAFGVPPDRIDSDAVEQAARIDLLPYFRSSIECHSLRLRDRLAAFKRFCSDTTKRRHVSVP